uniref:Uncharacterized protein n=1 Tax=Clytia hemisphaerica TaxID=252671 RepID=A0A7M5URA9_9CNID
QNTPSPVISANTDTDGDDDDDDGSLIAIVILIIIIILIIILVLILLWMIRKRKTITDEKPDEEASRGATSLSAETNDTFDNELKSEATLGRINFGSNFNDDEVHVNEQWQGLSQIQYLYGTDREWKFEDDEISTVDVDATSRIRFLFESQNSLRHLIDEMKEGDEGRTIYDEDGTEMETYRSNGGGAENPPSSGASDDNQDENENNDDEMDNTNEEDNDSDDDSSPQSSSPNKELPARPPPPGRPKRPLPPSRDSSNV